MRHPPGRPEGAHRSAQHEGSPVCSSGAGRIARWAGLVTTGWLAGCMSLAPAYQRPPAPVAERFPGSPGPGAPAAPAAADIGWEQYFSDERLKRLIALALRNNRDLRVAVLNVEQARAQFQIRRADRLPTLNLGAGASRQTNADGGVTDSYLAGFSVSQFELDFFGRVGSLSDAALAQFLATEEARKAAQIMLVAAVANSDLALRADEEQLGLAARTLATRAESLKLTRLKFDQGVSSALDVAQAESLVEGARVAHQILQRQRAQSENALVLLLGEPTPIEPLADATLLDVKVGPELPAGLPSELLGRRPDIRQAEQQLKAASANIGAARAAFFPRITLTGSAGIASGDLLGLFKAGSLAWLFSPQLVVPIFDAGRNQANLEASIAQRDIGIASYERAIQTAFREVADALVGRATLGEQLRAQRAMADAEAARYRLSDLRYRSGVANYLDVLDAQRSLFVAQLATVQVQLARLQNQVTLYKVLGGGWTEAAPL
jgi:outer membrane protein, multidrug efflux system